MFFIAVNKAAKAESSTKMATMAFMIKAQSAFIINIERVVHAAHKIALAIKHIMYLYKCLFIMFSTIFSRK